ncbi:MAG: DUF4115 domain-containing protein [Rhodobacterales bacterium]
MVTSAKDFRPKGFDEYPLSLGDMMRGERATIGKSPEEVQRDLKVGVKYILAIENGDLSAFETKGFIAGYVRSYARYLNMDGDKAYAQFCSETGFDGFKPDIPAHAVVSAKKTPVSVRPYVAANDVGLTGMGPLTLPKQRWYEKVSFSAIGSLLVLLILVAGLGYGGWKVLQEVQKVQFAPVNETPGVASDVSVLADGGKIKDTSPALDRTSRADPGPTLSLAQLYRPQELDVPSVIARDGPIATIDPETFGTYAPVPNDVLPQNTASDSPISVVEKIQPTVDIVATRPAWVRVYQNDGSVLFEKILNAGERYRLPANLNGPLLKAGNSGAVYLMVGLKTYGPIAAKGGVARNISLAQTDIEKNYKEVKNLFSKPLAPPLNLGSDLTAEAILKDIQSN